MQSLPPPVAPTALFSLVVAVVMAAAGLAQPGVTGGAPSPARFEGIRHDAAAVTRVDVQAAAEPEAAAAAAEPAVAAAAGPGIPGGSIVTRPAIPDVGARPGLPAPELVLGPSDGPSQPADGTQDVGSTPQDESTAPLVAAEAPAVAPLLATGFPGMDDTVNGFVAGCAGIARPCIEPPDPWVAANGGYVVQAVNIAFRITDRSGGGATTIPLSTFFAQPPDQVVTADPRVIYDPAKGWFATALSFDCTAGHLYLAESDGPEPTGTWTVHRYDFPAAVPDYPGIGTASDKLLLGVNLFQIVADPGPDGCTLGTFTGASLLVVDWSVLGLGSTAVEFGPDPDAFTWRPAVAQSPGTTAFAVVEDLAFGFVDVAYAAITGTVAGGDLAIGTFRNLSEEGLAPSFAQAPQPAQPGVPSTIAGAVDHRPTDAVWRAGRLWTTATYPCQIEVLHACIRVTEIDTADPAAPDPVLQDQLLGWQGFDSYMAGIGLSVDGTAFIAYSRSSAVAPAGIHVVHQRAGDPTFRGWHQLVQGTGTYLGERWGDYAGVATDYSNPGAVWATHQYSDGSGGWATWVGQLSTRPLSGSGTISRLAGSDRYATAATISEQTFSSPVAVAYVATGANYPDALAGGAAAAFHDAPLLLVTRDSIPTATANELGRLHPGRIVVLGGAGVVSEAVKSALGGYTTGLVTRLSGSDRYATAAAISAGTFPVGVSTAYVAVGTNYPDALAGGPAAGLEDSPLLLVRSTSIPDATIAELTRLKPATIVVLGGTGVVSAAVMTALAAYATTGSDGVVRYSGPDRYATTAAVSAAVQAPNVATVYVATGMNYPDALAGGAAAAFSDSPLLLVTFGSIPASTATELTRLSPGRIVVLGGLGVISATVYDALAGYVAP
ncbi:MAG: cell wall-binding repeat-containing protein [Chloroflexota bacterium]|nr:MAG: cell wall-binding repeat-containing protein [Chloroflexota bacterium]